MIVKADNAVKGIACFKIVLPWSQFAPQINLETSLGITHATNLARQSLAQIYGSQFYNRLLIVDMYILLKKWSKFKQQWLYIYFIAVS